MDPYDALRAAAMLRSIRFPSENNGKKLSEAHAPFFDSDVVVVDDDDECGGGGGGDNGGCGNNVRILIEWL